MPDLRPQFPLYHPVWQWLESYIGTVTLVVYYCTAGQPLRTPKLQSERSPTKDPVTSAVGAKPHTSDTFGVVCLATQWWNIRRKPDWTAVARKLAAPVVGSSQSSADTTGNVGPAETFTKVPQTAEWLSKVEIKT